MKIGIDDARELAMQVLETNGIPSDTAGVLTDHLIDAHCTGYTFAGLPRLLVLLDRLREIPKEDIGRVDIVRETSSTAWLNGRGNLGYLTCQRSIELGIEKAKDNPIVMVSAHNSHYSGRLGYYVEQAAREGLIALHCSNASPIVAPPGSATPILGTNPICVAYPTPTGPMVCDINTAAVTRGSVDLANHLGVALDEGVAVDKFGQPTTVPSEALDGAILPWGGHKGIAMSLMVAAFGILAGGDPVPGTFGNWGYLFILIRPDAFLESGDFEARMGMLGTVVRGASDNSRMPGDRGAQSRIEAYDRGTIDVPDEVIESLRAVIVS